MIKSKKVSLDPKSYAKSPANAGLSSSGETIASLASGSGLGAVSIIRVSGPDSFPIIARVTKTRREIQAREMVLASIVDPESGDVIDESMIAAFLGPNSFTGEDSVEIFCHGGPYIVNRVLSVLFAHGCRPAEPGEYTKRAFLNGKMDLTAAEGIRELVEASSHQQWVAARQLATGRLGQYIQKLRKDIIGAMAYLEARIDFPDEGDTQGVALDHVRDMIKDVDSQVLRLQNSYENGRVASSGLMVAIVGAPNMGKSSLMNALLDKDRAIVTDIAGTTRDYIEERCVVNGRLIRLVDTAGIRETDELVEKIGVDSAIKLASEADLIVVLVAANASEMEQAYFSKMLSSFPEDKCLKVINKIDLENTYKLQEGDIGVSCSSGNGLENLRNEIASRVDHYVGKLTEDPFVTSARHMDALTLAKSFLEKFFQGMDEGLYEEMLAFELQNAVRALSSIIGDVEHDDLLERIFSEFCVGK